MGREIANPGKVLLNSLKAVLTGNAGIAFLLIWCAAAAVLLLYLLIRRRYTEFAVGCIWTKHWRIDRGMVDWSMYWERRLILSLIVSRLSDGEEKDGEFRAGRLLDGR